jgi:glyoxylase-like metal-dependent hydrolase (beta-lactamase superfamily II)
MRELGKMEHAFEHTWIPVTTITSGKGMAVEPDVWCLPIQIVNIIMVGDPSGSKDWVLIDAGMPGSANKIAAAAEERYGTKPKAIILTHGHFDHVGAIVELVEMWQIPVYAHELEMPYLTGKSDYPPADPTVDGGLVSEMSPFFPHKGINLENHINALPADGSVPEMSDWHWLHTPGHTPGHISLYREKDRLLVAGDAFVTVKQESLYKVIMQEQEISGPPKYFTTDWDAAQESVRKLQALNPSAAVTGHGIPMSGEMLSQELAALVQDFKRIAVPAHGRFVY